MDKNEYRRALHIYLINAYPDDDEEYYSKWAWLAYPGYWDRDAIPTEARFGCHCSGNTKLRCYPTGFMFDTNHAGDPPEIVAEVKRLKKAIEDEWEKNGIKVCGR